MSVHRSDDDGGGYYSEECAGAIRVIYTPIPGKLNEFSPRDETREEYQARMAAGAGTSCVLCAASLDAAPVVNEVARHGYPQRSVACPRCAMVQESPMPSAESLTAYYASGDYRREFAWTRSPDERADDACAAAEWLRAHLGDMRRSLEIGCGEGRVASWLGADAIEADPAMAAEAASRGVHVGSRGAYDVVYALQVIEHQADPVASLREWRGMLAPGGRVHVQLPTLERMYGGASHFFQRPHVANFTRLTLGIALRMAGLRPTVISVSGCVMYATAERAEPMTFAEASAYSGPVDDVPALLAAHEAERRRPLASSDVLERWIEGASLADLPTGSEAALRLEVLYLAESYGRLAQSVGKVALDLHDEAVRLGETWDADPLLYGYAMGKARQCATVGQVLAAVGNQAIVRATSKVGG